MQPFIENDTTYEGRTWLDVNHLNEENYYNVDPDIKKKPRNKIRFLSYHIFANYKCQAVTYCGYKAWEYRSYRLLHEISVYDADIICLQDVDNFQDFWRPKLMLLGYDCIFKRRTHVREVFYEGVLVAYKRAVFQMFKTFPVDLNLAAENYTERGLAFQDRCVTDDVGLIVLLQPWNRSSEEGKFMPPSVCVGK